MRTMLISVLIIALHSCRQTDPGINGGKGIGLGIVTIEIDSRLRDCQGFIPQKCFYVREQGQTNWYYMYEQIEGFTFEAGYTYELVINGLPIANPPADGSSIRYVLVRLNRKTKV